MQAAAKRGAVILIASLAAAGAHADWQYTKWDMSSAELIAASGGTATLMAFDEASVEPTLRSHLDEIRAAAPSLHAAYSASGIEFDAKFHFTGGKLDKVYLEPITPGQCSRLRGELNGQYGEPNEHYASDTFWWRDVARGNYVMFAAIGASCSITYQSLVIASRTGL